MTVQATAVKAELESAIADIWEVAQNAEGSRSGMQDALDQIQDLCSDVIPDVEERVTGIDDEETEENENEESD